MASYSLTYLHISLKRCDPFSQDCGTVLPCLLVFLVFGFASGGVVGVCDILFGSNVEREK